MKRLNNKGMSLIELIVCFAIVSAITVSMLNVIMTYQNKEIEETTKSDIISYKNNITRLIQNDIIKGELRYVTLQKSVSGKTTIYRYTLGFNRNLINNAVVNGTFTKILEIHANDTVYSENYITYQDINKNGGIQNVKYLLPSLDDNCTDNNCNITKFTAISTNINDTNSALYNSAADVNTNFYLTNKGANYFNLDITISNSKVGGDYHIVISSPLNYSYCKATT